MSLRTKPQVIPGMTFRNVMKVLARNNFQVDTPYFGRLAHVLAMGLVNSFLSGCEEFFNMKEIDQVEPHPEPVFVLGHWRSGTTHLHNLLSLDLNLRAPTAYQACFPGHFIFSQAGGFIFNWIAPPTRPMDNVAFSAQTPHEEEFGLAADATISPYMRVWFPRTGDLKHSILDPGQLSPGDLQIWKSSFLLFLKKFQFSEGKRPVLKSPPHMGKIKLLLELFPKAKFVHIVRNPYMVYRSTQRLWNASLQHACLQYPDQQLVEEIILSWYIELFELYERDKGLIPENALYELRYEDLEMEPVEVLHRMYDVLQMPDFDKFQPRVLQYLETIKNYKKNEHSLSDSDKVKIRQNWGFNFAKYGYTD